MDPNSAKQEAKIIISSDQNPLIKHLVIITVMCLLLTGSILIVLNFFKIINLPKLPFLPVKQNYALTIDGENIPSEVFNKQLRYTQTILGVIDQSLAKKKTIDTFIERQILRSEVKKRNLVIADTVLNQATKDRQGDLEYREAVKDRLIIEKIKPLIETARDAEVLMVAFGYATDELKGIDQKKLALSKIEQAREQIAKGSSPQEVSRQLKQDKQVKILNRDGLVYFKFPNTTKDKIIFTRELTEAIFSLNKPGVPTEIILLSGKPEEWGRPQQIKEFGWSLGVVTNISENGYLNFESWLSQKKEGLNIKIW